VTAGAPEEDSERFRVTLAFEPTSILPV